MDIIGQTPDGRGIIRNADGSISTERTITVVDPRLNDGRFTNIPSMYGGKELSERAAIQRVIEAKGTDPETGRALGGFETMEEAISAAKARSGELGKMLKQMGLSE